jgi:septum formation protein
MLLEQLRIKFDVISSDIHEDVKNSLTPEQIAESLALRKAQAVAASLSNSNCIVIGADTIVVDNAGILGKPKDETDAYRMLSRLSGRVHRVITGVALISTASPSKPLVGHETTKVKIATLSDQDIKYYIQTDEPLDKAGAYAIQGKGTVFVEWIHGCYNNVVGLPLFLLVRMLRKINSGFRV